MRRFVLSLAALSAFALTACSGGGSVLSFSNSNTPDRTIVTASSPNIARVLPGASLALSAVAVRGSQNGFLSNNRFTWSAALVTSGIYPVTSQGQTKPCGTLMLVQSGTPTPYTNDFSMYLAIDPVNEQNVLFIPPVVVPVPSTATPGSTITGTTGNIPYCVVISATPAGGDASNTGSITVAVVNPLAPTL